jgi:hypothetical protein
MIYLEIQYETESKYFRFSSLTKAMHYITIRGTTNWCLTDLPMADENDKIMTDDEYEFVE